MMTPSSTIKAVLGLALCTGIRGAPLRRSAADHVRPRRAAAGSVTADSDAGPFSPPWNDEPALIRGWDAWCAFEQREGCYACKNTAGAGKYCTAMCADMGCPGFHSSAPAPAPSPSDVSLDAHADGAVAFDDAAWDAPATTEDGMFSIVHVPTNQYASVGAYKWAMHWSQSGNAAELQACADYCLANTACMSFTFYSEGSYSGKTCKLMTTALESSAGYWYQSSDASKAMHHYVLTAQRQQAAHDSSIEFVQLEVGSNRYACGDQGAVTWATVSSAEGCEEECRGSSGCSSFTFYSLGDFQGQNCKLMTAELDANDGWCTTSRNVAMVHFVASTVDSGPVTLRKTDVVEIATTESQPSLLDLGHGGKYYSSSSYSDFGQNTAEQLYKRFTQVTLKKVDDPGYTGDVLVDDVLSAGTFGIFPKVEEFENANDGNPFNIRLDVASSSDSSNRSRRGGMTALKIVPCDGSDTVQYNECVQIFSASGMAVLDMVGSGQFAQSPDTATATTQFKIKLA